MAIVSLLEDFLDDSYQFTFMQDATYPWNRSNGQSPDGSTGFIKSSNYQIGGSSSTVVFIVDVPPSAINPQVKISYVVDSEERWDKLQIFLNNIKMLEVSGPKVMDTIVLNLSAGSNGIGIAYSKDAAVNRETDSAYVSQIEVLYEVASSTPVVRSTVVDFPKISKNPNLNKATVLVQFDTDVTEYVAMLGGVDQTTGINVHTGGPIKANTNAEVVVDWNELTSEGPNKINIYGKNSSGWTKP